MNKFDINTACCFTGHRIIAKEAIPLLQERIFELCKYLIKEKGVTHFICGGALGFDTLAAKTVLELRKCYPQTELHLYFPCTDQSIKWRDYDKAVWERLRLSANDYQFITDMPYVSGCMQLRNQAMVNDSMYCIAYCKNKKSGTYSTVRYAQSKGRHIHIISDL